MEYRKQIDGLRFFAIVSVLIGHWMAWETDSLFLKHAPWGHGVVLFFVISGFLITDILLGLKEKIESGKITFSRALKVFYIRRFLRIFPVYYLLIFYLYYINYPKTREIFVWLVTYTSNILQSVTNEYQGNFNHFWSLAVEEQFYLFWPLLILVVKRKYLKGLFFITMIVAIISRVLCAALFPEKWMLASYFTLNQMFPLALGGLLAFMKRENPSFVYRNTRPVFSIIALFLYAVIYCVFAYKKNNFIYTRICDEYVFSMVCALFVITAYTANFSLLTRAALENKFVVYFGKISYGIYIYHLFIISFFWDIFTKETRITTDSKHTAWFLYFVICFGFAIISYHLIEHPINNLKKRFRY